MKTRSQELAAVVMGKVKEVEKKDKTFRDQYGGMAHKLPVLIRTAGLVQAVTFVEARGQKGAQKLLTDLAVVLGDESSLAFQARLQSINDLAEYMHVTQQALTALLWYKRFAQSILDIDNAKAGESE